MFEGKRKAVTFSFDDGVAQDRRLVALFDKYGLKGTFNLNSGLLGQEGKIAPEEVRALYQGHEVAAHTKHHPLLTECSEREIISQVEEDRIRLSELAGYEVIGMAYPCGGVNYDERVKGVIAAHTKIQYSRTILSSHSFDPQEDLLAFRPTVYIQEKDLLFELAEAFLQEESQKPQLLYVWGHAYEFDYDDSWGKFEEFCRLVSGHGEIFYGTNREVFSLG